MMIHRWLVRCCLVLLAVWSGQFAVSSLAMAQEEAAAPADQPAPAAEEAPAAGEAAPVTEGAPAEQLAEGAPAEQPAEGATPAAGGEEATKDEHFIMWLIKTSGWIGAFLLLLSIYFLSTSFRLFTELRAKNVMPSDVLDSCAASLEKRDLKGLYATVKEDDSEYSRLVRTGIAELPLGITESRNAMERAYESIHAEGERKIAMLAVIGTLGPMIGLLGTLLGMIGAFSRIAMSEGSVLKASEVAGEISTALVLTFEGVLLSVPAIFLHALFRNMTGALHDQAFHKAEELVTKVAGLAKRPASSSAPPPPPAN